MCFSLGILSICLYSNDGEVNMNIDVSNSITPEILQELHTRYPILGAMIVAAGGQGFTICCYDNSGNEVKIIAQAGDIIRYQETPVTERQVRSGTPS